MIIDTLVNRAVLTLKGIQENLKFILPSFRKLESIQLEIAKILELLDSEVILNPKSAQQVLEVLIQSLDPLFDLSVVWPTSMEKSDRKLMQIHCSKLRSLRQLIPWALSHPLDDLLVLDRDHHRWGRVESCTSYAELEEYSKLIPRFQSYLMKTEMTMAIVSKTSKTKNKFLIGYYIMKYLLNKIKQREAASALRSSPSLNTLKQLWNDKKLKQTKFSKIKHSKLIYVKRNEPSAYFSFSKDPKKIPLRVISPFPILSFLIKDTACIIKSKKPPSRNEGLIFHIHGGSFISKTSKSSQFYTRQWALALNVPVISVDYRLAPEFPFPAGLDDIWDAYRWIVANCATNLGISSSKIIIVGDSAGGNLALALMLRILKCREQLPAGMFLCSPWADLSLERFSPSLLNSIEDKLMPYTFLTTVISAYVQKSRDQCFISPIRGQFEGTPPVRIFVGDKDPFLDDSLRLIEKLSSENVDVKAKVYANGFYRLLAFDTRGGLIPSGNVIQDSIKILKELL